MELGSGIQQLLSRFDERHRERADGGQCRDVAEEEVGELTDGGDDSAGQRRGLLEREDERHGRLNG